MSAPSFFMRWCLGLTQGLTGFLLATSASGAPNASSPQPKMELNPMSSPAPAPLTVQAQSDADALVHWPGLPPPIARAVETAEAQAMTEHQDKSADSSHWHTRWLSADGLPWFTNRLILSQSPYLLEHAHNPVNWYSWGPEALAAAKAEHKPLFISIGYASCHWCHVMAQQSFESAAVARLLNQSFIAVKVDRQQNPEIDSRYQMAVAIVGGGQTGWPASIYAFPDGRPFYATLYQPEPAFLSTLKQVAGVWQTRPTVLDQDADKLTGLMRRVLDQQAKAQSLDAPFLVHAAQALAQRVDPFEGGFGDGVKFPDAERLMFLLDQLGHTALPPDQITALRNSLDLTLEHMRRGGIYDQLGGGFFRYSTTPDWRVPHFEKMAYDQAVLARTYLRAGLVLGRRAYWRTAENTLDFVLDQMRAPDGGFIAALDADSALPSSTGSSQPALHEGAFYTWSPSELAAVLPPEAAKLAAAYWQVTPAGDIDGMSVLHRASAVDEAQLAKTLHLNEAELNLKMVGIRKKLLAVRARRSAPRRDGNRITSWNGLLIQALAEGGRLLDQPRFVQAAAAAAQFVDHKIRLPGGRLAHNFNRGVASGVANLADHADYALGLIALYDATGEKTWLDQAQAQAAVIEKSFAAPAGGYFDQPNESKTDAAILDLPSRPYEDGPEPAGNTQTMRLFVDLAVRTGDQKYTDAADALLAGFSGLIARDPLSAAGMLAALTAQRAGAIDPQAYGARGGLHAGVSRRGGKQINVLLAFAPGWHVNAHDARSDLIPTQLTSVPPLQLALVDYPAGKKVRLAFSDTPLNLYEGTTHITGVIQPDSVMFPQRVRLDFQACNNEICLAPAQMTLWLPPHP
ncbi:thioredoxin domain-containing protein [Halothiobacillus sp.]|uniref:thioredoxin domain-containing protein n=1 Tax=Halothiobacillus sp. TaxID=1891311 RepID=UPI002AD50DB1|nr:thioredoxin domain-containing protein [Halothiobacillus sp.]